MKICFEFRVCQHQLLSGQQMVECWRDGIFVAGIYPHQDGIRIVSKYMADVVREDDPVRMKNGRSPSAVIKLSN